MIVIDEEFKKLIPPLTADEFVGLEKSLLDEGCRDALVLWGDTLIDGHNRYEICTKYHIPFETVQKEFASRDDVLLWMIDTQNARRNLSNYAKVALESRKAEILSKKGKIKQSEAGGDRKSESYKGKIALCDFTQSEKKPIDVKKEIAAHSGVGEQTASRVMVIEKKIEQAKSENKEIAGQNPESIRQKLMSGDVSINRVYNAVKLEEKKAKIKEAEQKIAEQAKDKLKPILHIGDSIAYTPDEKYDLLLTDPPYSTDVDDIDAFVESWLYKALENVKPTGFAYVFIGAYPKELKAYLNAKTPEHITLSQQLIWTYKNTLGNNPKDRYKQNYQVCLFYRGADAPNLDCPLTSEQWAVQEINAPDGRQGDRYHAWQKPMDIAERFIRHSTKQGMVVFDPFACTGTFLLAAAKLGRKAYGFEINPENAKIAFERGCVNEP